MHRFPALLRGAAACLIAAVAWGTALAKPVPIERRLVHPDGVSIVLQTIDIRDDSIVLAATIANPGEREIRLDRARSLVLDDGAHGIHHLNPPADNPELRIPAHTQTTADLVFVGPLATTARELTLSINQGIGTPDNPYDDAPAFSATLPADRQAEASGGAAASHPDGAGLLVRRLLGTPTACVVSLLATNGNDRTIVLNQDRSLVLTDDRGVAAPVKAPAENRELVVPPGDRLDADLVFDCRTLDAGGGLTLITNRGTAGTTDNPYDTLPVFTVKLPVEHSDASPPASSRAAVAPIARTLVSAAEAAVAAPPASPSPAAATPAAPAPAPSPPPRPAPPPAKAVPAKNPAASSVPQLEAALHAAKTDRGFRIVLPADELFGAAPDTLDASSDPLLAQLAELIAKTRPREVVVAGHTDSVGTDDDNLLLSQERAHVVAAWLAARAAKRGPHFVEQGYGRTRPVAPNHKADGSDNPEGRAQNRRIELLLRR
jgi:outer membrane protein OmpA-like peptidoglycan-associated protein